MNKLASIASYIFHPLLMPLIGFLLMYVFSPYIFSTWTDKHATLITLQLFINTVLFPLLSTVLMVRLGFIESIKLPNREDRILPLIAAMIFFIWTLVSLRAMQPPFLFLQMMFGATISLVLAFIANLKFKVSLHTIGAGNLVALIIFIIFQTHYQILWLLILGLIVAGIIGTARLWLNAHNREEVIFGYIIGLISQFAAYLLLFKII